MVQYYGSGHCVICPISTRDYYKNSGRESVIKKRDGVVLRRIHELYYLIDIKHNYNGDKCYLYETNEIGAFLWKNIDSYNTVKALAHLLYEQIVDDIEEEVILSDVEEYIRILKAEGFVEDEK